MSSDVMPATPRRVLVTGGAGLLGNAITRRLVAAGMEVVATYRGSPPALAGVQWQRADLTRSDALADIAGVDALVHTAALLPQSHASSDAEAEANRRIDEVVFAATQRWGARLVFISTVAVYGATPPPPEGLTEDHAVQPIGAYAREKVWAEERGRELEAADGLAFTSLRVSAPYGRDQRSMTVLRRFVERASRGETLEYWGSGARQQDFIHADDVATASEASLSRRGGTFNIASGKAVTMLELASTVADAAGLPADQVRAAGAPDPGEDRLVAYSIARARSSLDWQPRIELREGVAAWLTRLGEAAER
jgi:nucleoside-diphosphate-sugar epimerase